MFHFLDDKRSANWMKLKKLYSIQSSSLQNSIHLTANYMINNHRQRETMTNSFFSSLFFSLFRSIDQKKIFSFHFFFLLLNVLTAKWWWWWWNGSIQLNSQSIGLMMNSIHKERIVIVCVCVWIILDLAYNWFFSRWFITWKMDLLCFCVNGFDKMMVMKKKKKKRKTIHVANRNNFLVYYFAIDIWKKALTTKNLYIKNVSFFILWNCTVYIHPYHHCPAY